MGHEQIFYSFLGRSFWAFSQAEGFCMRLSRRFLVQYPWTLQAKPLGVVGLLPRICQENATCLSGKCGGFICSV